MEKGSKKPNSSLGSKWNTTLTPPAASPDIILVFHGLMALFQPNNQKLEFICHGWQLKHKLKVKIGKCNGGVFQKIDEKTINAPKLEFSTTNSADEVKVFADGNFGDRSFDWIIDIEKEHGQELDKIPNPNPHSISIENDGVLFTYARTTAEFYLDGDSNWNRRPIAAVLGMNFNLAAGTKGILKGYNPTPKEFPKNGDTHVIIFDNDCQDHGKRCEWHPNSGNHEERNDFFLNYRNIIDKQSSGVDEYYLRMDADQPGDLFHFFENGCRIDSAFKTEDKVSLMANNRAPCAATAYGETESWS